MNLLPVGSIVTLEGGQKRLAIIGIMQNNDGKIFDYLGCPYPEGYIDKENLFLFYHKDIAKVDYIGFADVEFQIFRQKLNDKLKEEGLVKE